MWEKEACSSHMFNGNIPHWFLNLERIKGFSINSISRSNERNLFVHALLANSRGLNTILLASLFSVNLIDRFAELRHFQYPAPNSVPVACASHAKWPTFYCDDKQVSKKNRAPKHSHQTKILSFWLMWLAQTMSQGRAGLQLDGCVWLSCFTILEKQVRQTTLSSESLNKKKCHIWCKPIVGLVF